MTFIIGAAGRATARGIPVTRFTKKREVERKSAEWKNASVAREHLSVSKGVAGQIIPKSTAFTIARDQAELDEFSLITGDCEYIGREGVEFYPQELLLFKFSGAGPQPGTVWLHNIQVKKSKYRIPRQRVLLETAYLHPLVKGPEIDGYQHNYSGLIVAFPYDANDPIRPIPINELREKSPHLLNYYEKWRDIIDQQTKFSDKIRGQNPGEFYGLARTGPYSFGSTYVAYRDNTNWCATVVSDSEMPWGERTRFVFQNHAVSMCERRSDSEFIGQDEAHFVCAIINTPIVERFIYATSDDRSYKIRPPVFIPLYDQEDDRHVRLAQISREAHLHPEKREALRVESENIYLSVCGDETYDAMIAKDRLEGIENGTVRLVSGDALQKELDSLLS